MLSTSIQCSPMKCSPMKCLAMKCSPVKCSPVKWSPMKCLPMKCSPVKCLAMQWSPLKCSLALCTVLTLFLTSRSNPLFLTVASIHLCDVHIYVMFTSVMILHFCFVHSALSSAAALMFKSPLSPFLVKVYLLLCPPSNPRSNCANFQAVCYVTESSISVTQCQSVDKYIFKKLQIDVLQFGEIHFAIWRNTFCDLEKYVLRF